MCTILHPIQIKKNNDIEFNYLKKEEKLNVLKLNHINESGKTKKDQNTRVIFFEKVNMSVPTIVIIGGSYAGTGLVNELQKKLTPGQAKIILIEKKSHFHNNFASVRSIVDPDFATSTFISLDYLFKKKELGSVMHDTVTQVTDKEVSLLYFL